MAQLTDRSGEQEQDNNQYSPDNLSDIRSNWGCSSEENRERNDASSKENEETEEHGGSIKHFERDFSATYLVRSNAMVDKIVNRLQINEQPRNGD